MPKEMRCARFAWAVLLYNLAVVLWGGVVRVTGSGAGCGNHWPLCNGAEAPLSATAATAIEFTHRVMSGLDAALVLALVVLVFRTFPRRHPARLAATLSGAFLLMEVFIGAGLVLLGHVASNASLNRAWSLSAHQVNTLTLLACLALTAWWAGGRPPVRAQGTEVTLAAISMGLFLLLGVSGAITALGDTLFPARSLREGFLQDVNPAANMLIRLRIWHPVMAACVGLWLGFYGVWSVGRRPDARLSAGIVMTLVGVQLAAGMVNLVMLAPAWMQLLHLLLTDLLWIAIVLHCAVMLGGKEAAVARKVPACSVD